MKEALSVTTIFQIVILFILLFTAIMALTINNSNAFGMKDEIISYIEANNGNYLNEDKSGLNEELVEKLANASYRTTGKCEDDEDTKGYSRTGEELTSNENASICIKKIKATDEVDKFLSEELDHMVATDYFVKGRYYKITVFFQLDLPVVKQIYNFQSKGETKIIYQN